MIVEKTIDKNKKRGLIEYRELMLASDKNSDYKIRFRNLRDNSIGVFLNSPRTGGEVSLSINYKDIPELISFLKAQL